MSSQFSCSIDSLCFLFNRLSKSQKEQFLNLHLECDTPQGSRDTRTGHCQRVLEKSVECRDRETGFFGVSVEQSNQELVLTERPPVVTKIRMDMGGDERYRYVEGRGRVTTGKQSRQERENPTPPSVLEGFDSHFHLDRLENSLGGGGLECIDKIPGKRPKNPVVLSGGVLNYCDPENFCRILETKEAF